MYAFTLDRPSALDAAVAAAAGGGQILAGGQTLLPSMKMRLSQPGHLVDLGGVKELVGVERNGDAVVIGAMTRHMDVANSAEVKAAIPCLGSIWPAILVTAKCVPWAPWAAPWPITIPPPATRAQCWVWVRRCTPTSAVLRRMIFPGHVHHRFGIR